MSTTIHAIHAVGKELQSEVSQASPDDSSGFRSPETPLLHEGEGDAFHEDMEGEIGWMNQVLVI